MVGLLQLPHHMTRLGVRLMSRRRRELATETIGYGIRSGKTFPPEMDGLVGWLVCTFAQLDAEETPVLIWIRSWVTVLDMLLPRFPAFVRNNL